MHVGSTGVARGKAGSAKVAALNADFARSLNGAASRSRVSTSISERSGFGVSSAVLPDSQDSTERLLNAGDRPRRVDDRDNASDASQTDQDKRTESASEDKGDATEPGAQSTADQSGSSVAAGTPVTVDPGKLLTRQPLTIETLNSVILLGGQSPRFSLIAPDQHPEAALTRPASEGVAVPPNRAATESTRLNEPKGPGAEVSNRREAPPQLSSEEGSPEPAALPMQRGKNQENKADARGVPDVGAPAARPSTVLREGTANIATHAAPIVVAGASSARPAPSTDSRGGTTSAGSISGTSTSKLLERLDPSANARATVPTQKADQDFERQLALQLQRGVTEALRSPSGTLTLRLQPAHLGQLRVQVKIDADQNLRARFEVASAKTRAALSGSIDELVSALAEKGVRVEDIAVTLRPRLPDRDLGLPPLRQEPDDAKPSSALPDNAQGLPKDAGPSFAEHAGQAVGAESGGAHSDQSSQRRSSQDAAHAGSAAANDISTPPAEPALDLFPIGTAIGQSVGLIGSVLHIAHDGRVRVDATA